MECYTAETSSGEQVPSMSLRRPDYAGLWESVLFVRRKEFDGHREAISVSHASYGKGMGLSRER